MQIACITDEIDPNPRTALEIGIAAGLRYFEIRAADTGRFPDFGADTMDLFKRMKDRHELCYTAVSPGLFKSGRRPDWVDMFNRARELGVDRMIVFAPAESAGWDASVRLMQELAAEASAQGFGLLLENSAGTMCRSAADVATWIAAVGATNLMANWDPANAVTAGVPDSREEYDKVARLIGAVHVKDLVPAADGGRPYVPVGSGIIDYPRLIDDLRSSGYQGYLTIETHCRPQREPFEQSLAYLRRLLG